MKTTLHAVAQAGRQAQDGGLRLVLALMQPVFHQTLRRCNHTCCVQEQT